MRKETFTREEVKCMLRRVLTEARWEGNNQPHPSKGREDRATGTLKSAMERVHGKESTRKKDKPKSKF